MILIISRIYKYNYFILLACHMYFLYLFQNLFELLENWAYFKPHSWLAVYFYHSVVG